VTMECRQLVERARSGRRVLVVDDHAGFRTCARALLESEGFDVVGEAADGESAVARAAEVGPDLVLLDIQLPDSDGFTVAEQLLAVDPQLRIVLVSSRDQASYGPRIEQSGAVGFVSKGDLSGVALARVLA
jgi:DNA-binding NarL/FixJ family response regulator